MDVAELQYKLIMEPPKSSRKGKMDIFLLCSIDAVLTGMGRLKYSGQ